MVLVTFVCPKAIEKAKRKEIRNKNKGIITIFFNNTGYLKTGITYSFLYLLVKDRVNLFAMSMVLFFRYSYFEKAFLQDKLRKYKYRR